MPLKVKVTRMSGNDTALLTKGEVTAERILDAAFRSIAAHGCGAVTLRGIAEEADVALSQLNYHYGNKDSLFTAVLKRMQEGYMEGLSLRLRGHASLARQITALVDYNAFVLADSPDTYRNFLEFFNLAMNSQNFRATVADFTSGIAAIIETCIAKHRPDTGTTSEFSITEITRFILSASFGIALQHFLSPENRDVRRGFDIVKASALQMGGKG